MSQEIRVGVAGLTHGHVGGLINAWKKVEGAKLVAVSDKTELLESHMIDFEASFIDWREMLEKVSLDVLVVTSDSLESAEITIAALEMGIPCLVEKAMAVNAADADRMLAAMEKSGKKLMINWPLAWNAWLPELKKQIEAGAVGHAFHLKFRNGHSGPREIGCGPEFVAWLYDEKLNGGGAIADFGSYGAVLARYLFGMPISVSCVRGNYTKDYDVVDDHAIITLRYPKGSAVLEGTWATAGWDNSANPVVHGKTGTLAVYGSELKKHVGREVEELTVPAQPTSNPAEYFLSLLSSGDDAEGILNPYIAADACRILDAAILADKTGVEQKL